MLKIKNKQESNLNEVNSPNLEANTRSQTKLTGNKGARKHLNSSNSDPKTTFLIDFQTLFACKLGSVPGIKSAEMKLA